MPYARPKGNTRFQEISQAKVGLPALEVDQEFNAIRDYLNSLGSYTANVNEWAIDGGVPTFVSLTQFTLVGDLTTTYLPHRRLRCLLGATPVYTAVDSSAYDGGGNLTTVTVKDEVLTVALSEIQYGLLGSTIDQLSIPITALSVPVVSKSVDYVATKHDTVILVDASGANRAITLPQVSIISTAARVRRYLVFKADNSANTVTVTPNAGDTINGAANYVLRQRYEAAELIGHGGTDWKVAYSLPAPGSARINFGATEPTNKEDGRVWYDETNKLLKYAKAAAFANVVLNTGNLNPGAMIRYASDIRAGEVGMPAAYTSLLSITFNKAEASSILVVLAFCSSRVDGGGGNFTMHSYKLYVDASPQDDTRRQISLAAYSFSGVAVVLTTQSCSLGKILTGLGAGNHTIAIYGQYEAGADVAGVAKDLQLMIFELKLAGT